jgi:hypothetical protein
MILGLPPLVFIHTLISLVGIVTGFIVMKGILANDRMDRMTGWFLALTILTSATGFILPATKIMPSHIVGVISLVILAIACYARYSKRMAGKWRVTYLTTAIMAQWFNCFVLVAQLFLKVPALHELAPEGSEPPFAIAQGVVLLAFIAAGVLSLKRFHPPG